MRIIIDARIENSIGGGDPIRLAEFERADGELKRQGLKFVESRLWAPTSN